MNCEGRRGKRELELCDIGIINSHDSYASHKSHSFK